MWRFHSSRLSENLKRLKRTLRKKINSKEVGFPINSLLMHQSVSNLWVMEIRHWNETWPGKCGEKLLRLWLATSLSCPTRNHPRNGISVVCRGHWLESRSNWIGWYLAKSVVVQLLIVKFLTKNTRIKGITVLCTMVPSKIYKTIFFITFSLKRAMGFPFDRPVPKKITTLEDFAINNHPTWR